MTLDRLTCDEDALERLEQRPVDVVAPEGVEVGQLGELDVADDGAEVTGPQDRVRLRGEEGDNTTTVTCTDCTQDAFM